MTITRRNFSKLAAGASLAATVPAVWTSGRAADQPIRIGLSLPLTGPLAAVKASQIGYELWRDDVNAAGGVLGRQVEFVMYDDQSSGATVPGIYSKLVDIDKVDLVFTPYGANLAATMMPFVKQRDLFAIGMFGTTNNDNVKHDKYFQIAPWGPDAANNWARGYFDIAKANGFKKVAIIASDTEFTKSTAIGGAKIAQAYGMEVVMNETYPPPTADFSAILRNLKAAAPDVIFVCSYPTDSVALVHGISEIGVADSVKMFGGSMVGLQYAGIMANLGSALNGIVNFTLYAPEPTVKFTGIEGFLARYAPIAKERNFDPLGYYLPPFYYAAGQLVAAAAKGAGSIEAAKMAAYLHANPVDTVVGKITYDALGNWSENRTLMVQFRDVKDKDVEQFRSAGHEIILDPPAYKSGDFIPLAKARG